MKGKLAVHYALEKTDPRNMPRLEDTLKVHEESFDIECDVEDLLDQVFERFNNPSTNPLLLSNRSARKSGLRADFRVGDYIVLTMEDGTIEKYQCDVLGFLPV